MKKALLLAGTLALLLSGHAIAQEIWENPEITGIDKMDAHTATVPFTSLKQALAGDIKQSACYHSLNGRMNRTGSRRRNTHSVSRSKRGKPGLMDLSCGQ